MRREIRQSRFASGDEILKRENINGVITLMPLVDTKTTYREEKETVVEKAGFLGIGKRMGERIKEIPTGSVDEPEMLSLYTSDNHDTVPAYKIMYYRPNVNAKWTSGRREVSFTASVILPKKIAEETFALIAKNPGMMREILRKFNPDFMRYIESDGQFRPDTKVLLVSEGSEAFERDQTKREKPITGVKDEFIKEVPAA